MLVHFDTIPPEGRDFFWTVTEAELEADSRLVTPLAATCHMRMTGPARALIEGTLQGRVELCCDRCLSPFLFRLDSSFQLKAVLLGDVPDSAAEEGGGSLFELIELEAPCVNLDELMRQQLLLALPEKRLCRENCAGLCPGCGVNLNAETCCCGQKEHQPALSALAALAGKK